MSLVLVFSFVVLAVLGSIAWMVARMFRPAGDHSASLEWLEEFSLDKYAPMERLLSETDYEFLEAQEGYDPSIAKRLKRERRRIFNDYLRHLNTDFHRLVTLANVMIIYSKDDPTELNSKVRAQQTAFFRTMLLVRFRATLSPLGLQVPDVSELVSVLGSMQMQVRDITPVNLMEPVAS